MAKADNLSFPIETRMKVISHLSMLADLSHSHEVTGNVHASFSSCEMLGNSWTSHSLITWAHELGWACGDFPSHLNFHRLSSWSISSGDGRSSLYISAASAMSNSWLQSTDGTRPRSVEDVAERGVKCVSDHIVNEWYCHVAKKMFLHTFGRGICPDLHSSCSPWPCRLHIHLVRDPTAWSGKVTLNLLSEALVGTLYLLYQVKSLNDVKGSTLQFDSDTFQVGQELIHCEKRDNGTAQSLSKAHCLLSYISRPNLLWHWHCNLLCAGQELCLHYNDIGSVKVTIGVMASCPPCLAHINQHLPPVQWMSFLLCYLYEKTFLFGTVSKL